MQVEAEAREAGFVAAELPANHSWRREDWPYAHGFRQVGYSVAAKIMCVEAAEASLHCFTSKSIHSTDFELEGQLAYTAYTRLNFKSGYMRQFTHDFAFL